MEIDRSLLKEIQGAVRRAADLCGHRSAELLFMGFPDVSEKLKKERIQYLDLVYSIDDILEVQQKLPF